MTSELGCQRHVDEEATYASGVGLSATQAPRVVASMPIAHGTQRATARAYGALTSFLLGSAPAVR